MPTACLTKRTPARLGQVRWSVWTVQAHLVVTDPAARGEATRITRSLLERVDAAASRFRADSEICRLASTGARGELVSPTLAHLLRAALGAAAATDGDVDPTLGNALRQLLVADRSGNSGQQRGAASVRHAHNWRSVHLEGDKLWMPSGLLLDLGATAKAAAADMSAEEIAQQLGIGVLVSLGGDLRIAGDVTPAEGWVVQVQDGPGEPSSNVRLAGAQAVATSSTLHRAWRLGDQTLHHILDPRTCQPAKAVWRTVTVAAETCLRANTISTACVVQGQRAPAFLRQTGACARLVAADGSVHLFGGFPA